MMAIISQTEPVGKKALANNTAKIPFPASDSTAKIPANLPP